MSDSMLPDPQKPQTRNEGLRNNAGASPMYRNPFIVTLWVFVAVFAIAAVVLYVAGSTSSPDLADYLSDTSLTSAAADKAYLLAVANVLIGVTGVALIAALLASAITWRPPVR